MNTNPKLKKLQQKKEQIDARIKLIEAREKSKAKKDDTRRKILIGAMIMEQMEKSDESKKKVLSSLSGFLTRPLDRKLFGLPDTKKNEKPMPEKKPDATAKLTEKQKTA